MTLIKIYCVLFFLSVLALQPIYSASKYIVPVLGFVILFVARGLSGHKWALTKIIIGIILLSNFAFITVSAIKQIGDNVAYLKGDHYAGYDIKTRAMFEELETIDIPPNTEVWCRKPEFLYILRGVKSRYPWDDKETK